MSDSKINVLYIDLPVWTDKGVAVTTGNVSEDERYELRMFRTGEVRWLPQSELRNIEGELKHKARLCRTFVAEEMLKLRQSLAAGVFPKFPDTTEWEMPKLKTPWPKGLGVLVKTVGAILRPSELTDGLRLIIDEQCEDGALGIALQWKEKDHAPMVERMEKQWLVPSLPEDFRWMDSADPDEGGPSGYVYLEVRPGVVEEIKANGFTGQTIEHKTKLHEFRIGSIRLALALMQMGYKLNKYASKNRPSRLAKKRAAAAVVTSQPKMDIF